MPLASGWKWTPLGVSYQELAQDAIHTVRPMNFRSLAIPIAAIATPLVLIVWSVTATRLPPADFTFNNQTELKTVDPALVTGQPEGRIIYALFEGLVRLDPKDRLPTKEGTAEDWTVSEDLLTYTFKIRKDARWSNGDPVTAEDYHYSLRRFLHPGTGAEYAYEAWYIVNAKKFTSGGGGVDPGDSVEIELHLPKGAHETHRGKMLYGKFIRKEPPEMPKDEDERKKITQKFFIAVDGDERCFVMVNPRYGEDVPDGAEACRQVAFDFREVGVKVIDLHTLEITLANPTPYWPQLMAFYPLFPVHRGCLEEHGAPAWTQPENIVTNGPFHLAFRRPRDRIRLVKSETYWNRNTVRLETIDALSIENRITSLNLYEKGQLDWNPQIPGNVVPDLMKADRDDFNPYPQLAAYYYKLNTTRKPLDDKRVRKALALALDRQDIVRTVTRGPEEPALHLVPPGIPNYESPTLGNENIEQARRLLAEAGYPEGRGFPRLEILFNTDEQHEAVAELVRKQWQRALRITVTLQNETWSSYQDRLRAKKYDIGRQAWIADYLDPNTYIGMYVTGGENNQTGWSHAQYDALVEAAKSEPDADKRLQMMYQAEEILMDEMPIVPLYFYVSRNMVRPHVRGFYNNLLDTHPLHSMWIDREQKTPNTFLDRDAQ
ncbi:MAG: peptide ABC transporter substrate-binding protein [Aeoliella sp.]